jgi:hypothetical protein
LLPAMRTNVSPTGTAATRRCDDMRRDGYGSATWSIRNTRWAHQY